jgi:hypothetical protein
VPGDGENDGTATVPVMVKFAAAMFELIQSDLYAIAWMVHDDATVNAPEYEIPELGLGVDPSMVYRIDAPSRVLEIVTC